jgi:ribose transport system substrate-binding protein
MRVFPILCLAALLGLVACGKRPSAPDGGGTAPARMKIAVIPKGTSHAFWKAVEAGAREAGSDFDVEILWDGPQKETEIDRQRAILEGMVNLGAAGIAIAPLDEKGMARPIESVIRKKIPVVIFDSNVDAQGYLGFVATDNEQAGRLAGQRMVERLGGKAGARLVVLRYAEGSGSTLRREKGFIDAVTAAGHQVVAQQYTDGTPEGAQTVAVNMLAGLVENGVLKADGIFASNESTSVGMLRALDRMGKSGVDVAKTPFVGFDSGADLVDGLRDGRIDALVVQNPRRMGYLAVETLVKHLRGDTVAATIDTGAEVVTRERLDVPAIRALVGLE